MLSAAKALCLTALDLYSDGATLAEAKREFEGIAAGDGREQDWL